MTEILQHPHPALRSACLPVTVFGAEVRALADKLWALMRAHEGVGIAANQIGTLLRVVVLQDGTQRLTLVNPRLVYSRGLQRVEEGCLSVQAGRKYQTRTRPSDILVEFVDCDGVPARRQAKGLLAAGICHELDHLEGRLFIDPPRAVA